MQRLDVRLREQRDAGGIAVEEVAPAHRADFPLGEEPGSRNLAGPLLEDGHIVMRPPEQSAASPATTEHERAQGRLLMSDPLRRQQHMEVLRRGLGIPQMKLDCLPFPDYIADGQAARPLIRTDQIPHQEIAPLEAIVLLVDHHADVQGALGQTLFKAAAAAGAMVHQGGTYLCIEGPQFSSRGESFLYRQWGVDVIGMTNMPEAKLAREAELCYATMALVTDYDCWHGSEESVTVEMILATLHNNVAMAKQILRAAVPAAADARACLCATALQHAIVTAPEKIPDATRKRLQWLIGKYLQKK